MSWYPIVHAPSPERPSNLEEDSPQEPGLAAGLGRAGGMRTSVCGQCRSYPRARSISPQLVMSSELPGMDILKPEALRTKSHSAGGRRERHTRTLSGLPRMLVELGSSPRLRSSPFAFTHFLQTFPLLLRMCTHTAQESCSPRPSRLASPA